MRIATNPTEANGQPGVDDDGNGYVDDAHGMDFIGGAPVEVSPGIYGPTLIDADANPETSEDNHGTAVAGLAAAIGNNSLGVVGVAHGCSILPVKIFYAYPNGDIWADTNRIIASIKYAGGLGANGTLWRGADVLNMSVRFEETNGVKDALQFAATKGRGGRGCVVLASSGNGQASRAHFMLSLALQAGQNLISFQQVNLNPSSIWLDNVSFAGGTNQGFEGTTFPPAGWLTGSGWTRSTLPLSASGGIASAMTSSSNDGALSLSINQTAATVGNLDFDLLGGAINVYVNGFFVQTVGQGNGGSFGVIGFPAKSSQVLAVGASSGLDQRMFYSQYGNDVDGRIAFLAPGGLGDIQTTDRTGSNGYSSTSDYTADFSGTSAASPIAAGVAALVISANSDMSGAEVGMLLKASAEKVGGLNYVEGLEPLAGGYNVEYGFGRINAASALAVLRLSRQIPFGWLAGGVNATGTSRFFPSLGQLSVASIGRDLPATGTTDEFYFLHQAILNNSEIVTRVNSGNRVAPPESNPPLLGTKTRLIIRESSSAGARYAALLVEWPDRLCFQRRTATNSSATTTTVSGISLPRSLRLKRTGNNFQAFHSANGSSWTQVGVTTAIAMSTTSPALIGVAASSGLPSADLVPGRSVGIFDRVTVRGPGIISSAVSAFSGNPQTIRLDHLGNAYVAIPSLHRVDRISNAGVFSLFAGASPGGFSGDGGLAVSARVNAP